MYNIYNYLQMDQSSALDTSVVSSPAVLDVCTTQTLSTPDMSVVPPPSDGFPRPGEIIMMPSTGKKFKVS